MTIARFPTEISIFPPYFSSLFSEIGGCNSHTRHRIAMKSFGKGDNLLEKNTELKSMFTLKFGKIVE